ncbi:MAG: hypothetical protein ACRD0A_02595 [Acidimicrobiales bacterium]
MTHTAITQTVTTEFIEVELDTPLFTEEEEEFLLELEGGTEVDENNR